MNCSVHVCRAALALALVTTALAEPSVRLTGILSLARRLARDGKYEHARTVVTRGLIDFPGDPTLTDLQAQLDDVYRRDWGARANGARPAPPSTVVPPLAPATAMAPTPGHAFTLAPGITLQWIPAGSFVMASTHGNDDDTPVTISRGFWLGRTEVTQEQWRALRPDNQNPSLFKGSNRPVDSVVWVEAMEFARVLTVRERAAGRLPVDYEYTLPTEAEWEYAARAGGNGSTLGEVARTAWHAANSNAQTHPVAQLAPNAWGLYDMGGNVAEWCFDGPAPYPARPVVDPIQAFSGSSAPAAHIVRGGSWSGPGGLCRPGLRRSAPLGTTSAAVGFRIALAPVRRVPARAEAP